MAYSEARRRKQLEKKKKKRNDKRHAIARRQSLSTAESLALKAKYPVFECYISQSLRDGGLGEVIISRKSANAEIAGCLFLVDRHCMGVKNCFSVTNSLSKFRELLDQLKERGREFHSVDPATARYNVEAPVAFARSAGLSPHKDYASCKNIFGDIDAELAEEKLELGVEGKPNFMPGPFEDSARIRLILTKLRENCGVGNFNYTLVSNTPDFANLPVGFDIEDADDLDDQFGNIDENQFDVETDSLDTLPDKDRPRVTVVGS